jgi:hypothetical protein
MEWRVFPTAPEPKNRPRPQCWAGEPYSSTGQTAAVAHQVELLRQACYYDGELESDQAADKPYKASGGSDSGKRKFDKKGRKMTNLKLIFVATDGSAAEVSSPEEEEAKAAVGPETSQRGLRHQQYTDGVT